MELREKLSSQVPERTETRAALGKQGPETTGQSFQGTIVRSITLQSPSIPVKNLFQAQTVWLAGLGEGEEEHCDWHIQCYSPLLSSQNYLAGSRKGGVGFSVVKITNALKKEERQCLLSKGKRRGKWQQTEETNGKASVKEDNYGHHRGHAVWMFPCDVTYFSPFCSFRSRHTGILAFLHHPRYIPASAGNSYWNPLYLPDSVAGEFMPQL